jgi:DNA invertase Pin-like site-specific DNA recombinase
MVAHIIMFDRGQGSLPSAWQHAATPSGKLMFQITGAFAEFERAMIRQRIHAGLKRAVANGKTLGRPLNDHKALEKARTALSSGLGINKVARQVGLSNSTVAGLKAEMLALA